MIKIIFYIKSAKVKLNGESPIFAKITLRNQSITLSTGKSITQQRWISTKKLRNVLKLDKEKVMKHGLELLHLQIERKFNELSKLDPEVSLNTLKTEIIGKSTTKVSNQLLDIFDKHNIDFKRKVKVGERTKASLQKYLRSKDLLQAFIKKNYRLDNIAIDKVNSAFIYNLESFLKYESTYKGKVGIKNNSVVKYFKNFKTVCNYGIKMELIEKNPFAFYSGKLNIKDATFLSQEELNQIESKIFTIDRLEKVKDIFLFSCYTGYAPIDASSLTSDNLIKDNNGDLWIKTDRIKTGIKANVPVLPPVQRIIDKYKDTETGLIPKISNQKMNAYLKEIADLCGIKNNLTWYVARHTFATTVALGNGIKIENVSAMMGHTNIRQTQHYAKVLDLNVMDDMKKLKEKYQ